MLIPKGSESHYFQIFMVSLLTVNLTVLVTMNTLMPKNHMLTVYNTKHTIKAHLKVHYMNNYSIQKVPEHTLSHFLSH